MIQPITLMLKKDQPFKWNDSTRHAFERVKEAISSIPVLVNPDLSKDFIMYVYNSDFSIAMFLAQKDDDGKSEHPIAFYSWTLKRHEVNYNFVERWSFVIVKGLKKFQHLIACNKTIVYVTHPSVCEYIIEGKIIEKRANSITKILE